VSYHEYLAAKELLRFDPPFYALLMAAIQRADTNNAAKLHAAWPELWAETYQRYHAPGGALEGEEIYEGRVLA
jgi:hypothetical protein